MMKVTNYKSAAHSRKFPWKLHTAVVIVRSPDSNAWNFQLKMTSFGQVHNFELLSSENITF